LLEQDASLRERTRSCVLEAGEGGVEQVSAEAGASCRAYEVVAALVRRMDGSTSENR
jgi:hypothetical protein